MENETLKALTDKAPWALAGGGATLALAFLKRWLGLEKKDTTWDALEETRGWVDDVKKDTTENSRKIAVLDGRLNAVEKSLDTGEKRIDRIEAKIDAGFADLRGLMIRHIEKGQ